MDMVEKELGEASMADSATGDRTIRGLHCRVRLANTSQMAVVAWQVIAVVEQGGTAKSNGKKT